jgi:hypothetical protein
MKQNQCDSDGAKKKRNADAEADLANIAERSTVYHNGLLFSRVESEA